MADGPDDIRPHLDVIAERIIELDMRYHGFNPASGGFYDTTATYTTDPDNPVMAGWIPGPGGPATGEVLVPSGFTDLAGRALFNPTVDVYEHWAARIPEIFEHYLTAPRASEFNTLLSFLATGTEKLSRTVVPEDDGIGLEYGSNDTLVGALNAGDGEISQLNGQAMNSFVLHWWGKLPVLFDKYSLVARMQWITARAEQQVWHHYWNDLEKACLGIAEGLLPGGGGADIPFKAIGTITEVLSWLPVVGNVAGKLNEVNSRLSTLNDLAAMFGHSPTTRSYDFNNGAPAAEQTIVSILSDLSEDVRNQEEGLSEQARTVEELMSEPEWDLGDPHWVMDADERSDLLTDGNLITLDWETIRFIADDILGIVATAFDEAAQYNRVNVARFAFTRDGLVGRAQLGPYNPMDNVANRLIWLCESASRNLGHVSEVLKTVGQVFRTQDDQVAEDMRARQELAALLP